MIFTLKWWSVVGGREVGDGGLWTYAWPGRVNGTSPILFGYGQQARSTSRMQEEMLILNKEEDATPT